MLIRCLDFETTGIPNDDDPHAVCEIGWCDIEVSVGDPVTDAVVTSFGPPQTILTNPGRPMPVEARAIHHISDADVLGAPSPDVAFLRLGKPPADYLAAHNVEFERKFYGNGLVPWLCSYKTALRLWPDAPSHSLQVLRYWLGLEVDFDTAMPPHRAGPDAYVGAALLCRVIETAAKSGVDIETLARWSSGPALLPRVPFGKHRGKRWEEVPADYLEWVIGQKDMDSDVKANARHHMKQRSMARAS